MKSLFLIFCMLTVSVFAVSYSQQVTAPTVPAEEISKSIELNADIIGTLQSVMFELPLYAHGGGLNACGCHFNRKTGECHCHRDKGCGCECQPSHCD